MGAGAGAAAVFRTVVEVEIDALSAGRRMVVVFFSRLYLCPSLFHLRVGGQRVRICTTVKGGLILV
jgi:hypothetical protein